MAHFEEVDPPWSDALVMVCSKCFKRRGGSGGELKSEDDLKGYLKSEFKHGGYKGKVRVVVSTCLDICPDDKLAVAVARRHTQPALKTLVVDFETKPEELYKELEKLTK